MMHSLDQNIYPNAANQSPNTENDPTVLVPTKPLPSFNARNPRIRGCGINTPGYHVNLGFVSPIAFNHNLTEGVAE
ncbi:MAG: hypothetical protein ACK53L_20725, partial [Pirellulaceae bacterium]